MTQEIFRRDPYAKSCEAKILAVDDKGVRLDCTVFYPTGGGQPGDRGVLEPIDGGDVIRIVDTVKAKADHEIMHITEATISPGMVGKKVRAVIDWERRYRLMRTHTLLHLLCAVIPAGVTGGSVREGTGRLDFDLPESTLDKEQITAALNRLVEENHSVKPRWISESELQAQPELVRTMSVKPPAGRGKVRLVDIDGIDLQPCGGTHVASTGEIGPVRVTKIEKKGKHNRRVNVALSDT